MPKISKKQIEVVNLEDEKEEEEATIGSEAADYMAARQALDNDIKTAEDKPAEDKPEDIDNSVTHIPHKKIDQKAQCPDCGKLVSNKTLKYTHKYQCSAKTQQHTPIKGAEPEISDVNPPTKPTVIQSTYFGRSRPQRYEHIKLF